MNVRKDKQELLQLLKEVINRPDIAADIKERAQDYIHFQASC